MKRVRVDIRFPKPLLDKIEEYQMENSISTRTAAIMELIRLGLKTTEEKE